MKPIVKNISIHGINRGQRFFPEDPDNFCINIRIIIGPISDDGEESFDTQVMSPQWIITHCNDEVILGMNKIIMKKYDWVLLQKTVGKYVSAISGKDWKEVIFKLKGLGAWEFDNYEEDIE